MPYAPIDINEVEVTQPAAIAARNKYAPIDINEVIPLGAEIVPQAAQQSSFLGDMGQNASAGIQGIKDLLSGNYAKSLDSRLESPETEALGAKLFPQGSQGTVMDALRNLGNTTPRDWSASALEKFGQTPEGKALQAIGGLHPVYNALGTAFSRYAIPAISGVTGASPETITLASMVAAPLGLKQAKTVKDPFGVQAAKIGEGTKTAIAGLNVRSPEQLQTVSAKIKQNASNAYAEMRKAQAELNKAKVVDIVNKVESSVNESGVLHPQLHSNTYNLLASMKNAVKEKGASLEQLDQWRQLLSESVKKDTTKLEGMGTDAFKSSRAISALDKEINALSAADIKGGKIGAVNSLLRARDAWAKKSRFETVADIVARSDGDANFLKRELNKLYTDKRKTSGWSKEELSALKSAAKSSGFENTLKILGKFGFDTSRLGSGVGAIFGSGVGASVGGPVGAVGVPLVGTLARQGQKALARGKTENLLKILENRRPKEMQRYMENTPPPPSALKNLAQQPKINEQEFKKLLYEQLTTEK